MRTEEGVRIAAKRRGRGVMSTRATRASWAVLAILAAGCAESRQDPNIGAPTPQAQAMRRMLADVNELRGWVYGSGDQATASRAANDLLVWSARMPELFPPAQASRDYLDMSPARAAAAPAAMTEAARSLAAAVDASDRPAAGVELARTEKSGCGSCHAVGASQAR